MTIKRTYDNEVFDRFTERWPQPEDQLFEAGSDAFFAEAAGERNYRLLRGYKRAGDILIRNAMSERYDRDSLIFPALFNYRHYVELALKAIIEDHGAIAGVSLTSKNHRLPDLWKLFVKIATEFGNDCSDSAAKAVGHCIDELASIDAGSTAFRYARNQKGSIPSLPTCGIDLVRLHDVMNGMQNFFECADLDFTHRSDRPPGHRAAIDSVRREDSNPNSC